MKILLISLVLISCKEKKQDNAHEKIGFYTLPENGKITSEEKERYANLCQIWYDSTLAQNNFNGSILVAKNGNIVFEKYNGFVKLGSDEKLNGDKSLHIASVSKTFTAMAVLKLWQEKKIQLDDELFKYFPDFNYPGVTIRSLLNHRSGLPNYLYFMEEVGWEKSKPLRNQDVYNFLVSRKKEFEKNTFKPNSKFNYCNTNYVILALLIEKLTNQTYAEYLKEQFFDPLNMQHSFVMENLDNAHLYNSYDSRGIVYPTNYLDGVYGDKNIFSTVEDLLKWDRFLRSEIIFKKETLAEAYKPYSNETRGSKNYGLGWRMNIDTEGKKVIYHNGWWHGYNAVFIRLIEEDVTIIALGNRYNRLIYQSKELLRIFGKHNDESDYE